MFLPKLEPSRTCKSAKFSDYHEHNKRQRTLLIQISHLGRFCYKVIQKSIQFIIGFQMCMFLRKKRFPFCIFIPLKKVYYLNNSYVSCSSLQYSKPGRIRILFFPVPPSSEKVMHGIGFFQAVFQLLPALPIEKPTGIVDIERSHVFGRNQINV